MKRFGLPARKAGGISLYGQGLEDMYLLRIFTDQNYGFYVDVGANDGIFVSNTYSLYRQGWRGICIEPNPEAYSKLCAHRSEDICLQIAVGNMTGETSLYWRNGITEGSALETFKDSTKHCTVKVQILSHVLTKHHAPAEFELLSLDVEGKELEVLQGMDWNRWRPRVVVMEYNSEGRVQFSAFDYLLARGYRPILINRWNVMFSRVWGDDLLLAHKGQDWFNIDRITI